ncbi:MAG: hypothetical protein JWR18_1588 [Segetibacter sp.]|nr:hypothetical protein [Segetibacter sp.]
MKLKRQKQFTRECPVYFPDSYQYRFQEINKSDTTVRQFELRVAQRIWFCDMFLFDKNFKQKAGKALAADYFKNEGSASMQLSKISR